ncbi:MAG: hypothetical protein WBP29_13815 [Candidatus Zixiibacteriota bacterium]
MQKTSWTEQVEQKKKQRRRRVFATSGLLALTLLFAYMFVWQRVYTLQLAEEYSHRKQNVRLLKEKCQSLQFDVELLSSLENIESIARDQLAMMPLREAQFAKVDLTGLEKKAEQVDKPAETIKTVKPEEKAKPVATTKPAVTKKKTPAKKPQSNSKSVKSPVKKSNTKKNKGSGRAGA